jgi:hypothetical protein
MKLCEMFKHAFTGVDNSTIDIGRILWAIGTLTFLGCSVYYLVAEHHWDCIAFGTGFGAVLAGGGLGLKLKENTEPKAK